MYVYTSSNFVFRSSFSPPLFGFDFQPANSGGVELARQCRPAYPGSVYRSSILLPMEISVFSSFTFSFLFSSLASVIYFPYFLPSFLSYFLQLY